MLSDAGSTGARAETPERPALARPHVVLDDDPTGVQTLEGVRVLLDADPARIRSLLGREPAVHVLTNSRALTPTEARSRVFAAAAAARRATPGAPVILRGDSTLRAHLLEEYLAVRDGLEMPGDPVLLLVPALPSAGRITVDGCHLMTRNGARLPVHQTEYAADGGFAYTTSNLLEWAEERSSGFFRHSAGRGLPLAELRGRGSASVREALRELCSRGAPAVLAPDAETEQDLEIIAEGFAGALADGLEVVTRCAPAFVGILGGTRARGLIEAPLRPRRLLLVCGSYVPLSTRQLDHLEREQPGRLVELDASALAAADADAEAEVARSASRVNRLLDDHGFAALTTPRHRPAGLRDLASGARVASGLARVVQLVDPRPDVIVSKGGITSAVLMSEGLGAAEAEVIGPIAPGVALWRLEVSGVDVAVIVVPGNVGADDLLASLVSAMRTGAP